MIAAVEQLTLRTADEPPETAPLLLEQIAAHTLAEAIRLGMSAPASPCQVVATVGQLEILVRISRRDRGGLCLCGHGDGSPAQPVLREVERNALEAAPRHTHAPVSVKRLANLAGYAYTSYFRVAITRLVDFGLLTRSSQGVRKASAEGAAS